MRGITYIVLVLTVIVSTVTVFGFGLVSVGILILSALVLFAFENIWHIYGKGREMRTFLEHYGKKTPAPQADLYANGTIIFNDIEDIGTVCLIEGGIHIYRLGICSVLIPWEKLQDIECHKDSARLALNDGMEINRCLSVPWSERLTESLPDRFKNLDQFAK